jgi:hypothetical protein
MASSRRMVCAILGTILASGMAWLMTSFLPGPFAPLATRLIEP